MSLSFVNMKDNYFVISQANFIASGCLRDGESMTAVKFTWPIFESFFYLKVWYCSVSLCACVHVYIMSVVKSLMVERPYIM